jgi:hypothetical protein
MSLKIIIIIKVIIIIIIMITIVIIISIIIISRSVRWIMFVFALLAFAGSVSKLLSLCPPVSFMHTCRESVRIYKC